MEPNKEPTNLGELLENMADCGLAIESLNFVLPKEEPILNATNNFFQRLSNYPDAQEAYALNFQSNYLSPEEEIRYKELLKKPAPNELIEALRNYNLSMDTVYGK